MLTRHTRVFVAAACVLTLLGSAHAQELSVLDGKADASNPKAYEATFLLTWTGESALKAEDLAVSVQDAPAVLTTSRLVPFREGTVPLAVVFIFPTTKGYAEKSWQIRSNLATALASVRPIDHVGIIGYDSKDTHIIEPKPVGDGLATHIEALKGWEAVEEDKPNVYNAIRRAIRLLEDVDGVRLRYIVVISDAEGAVSTTMKADQIISQIRQFFDGLKITPVMLAYAQGKLGAHFSKLQTLGTDGVYLEAQKPEELSANLDQIMKQMYNHYLFEGTFDSTQAEGWMEPGTYAFGFETQGKKSEIRLPVHELEGKPEEPKAASKEEPSGLCSALPLSSPSSSLPLGPLIVVLFGMVWNQTKTGR